MKLAQPVKNRPGKGSLSYASSSNVCLCTCSDSKLVTGSEGGDSGKRVSNSQQLSANMTLVTLGRIIGPTARSGAELQDIELNHALSHGPSQTSLRFWDN